MIQGFRGALAATALAVASTIPASVAADAMADEKAILEIWATYSAARVAGDAKTWLDLWDEEGIRMPPGVPAVDFATFAPGTPERFTNSPASMEVKPEEVVVTGGWAYSRGTFTVNDTVEGKFLTIFRRQDDGSWRIYRDAFNMNAE